MTPTKPIDEKVALYITAGSAERTLSSLAMHSWDASRRAPLRVQGNRLFEGYGQSLLGTITSGDCEAGTATREGFQYS